MNMNDAPEVINEQYNEGPAPNESCPAEEQPAPQPQQPMPLRPVKRRKLPWSLATNKDLAFALICLILSAVTAHFFIWSGVGAGVAVSAVAILLVSVCFLAGKGMKMSAYAVFSMLAYTVLAVSLAFSDADLPKILAVGLLTVIYSAILISCMPLRRFEAGTYKSVGDICYAMFALTFGRIGRTWYAVFHKPNGNKIINRKTGSILIGFALAIPVLGIVIPLLISSDAAFDALLDNVTYGTVFKIAVSIIVGAVICLLWFGQLYAAGEIKREKLPPRDRRGVEPTILASFLFVLSLAYLIYIFAQLAYFFNGFAGLLPEGFTTADYARRGFFEMTAVCAINLLIVFLVIVTCRKRNDRAPLPVRGLCAFLCLFSMFLIATSLSKMMLYINSYGMTRLRIYTSVFMVFLAVVFISVFIRMFVRKMPYMKLIVIAAALLVAGLCYLDVDGVIAKYNVNAYLDGRLEYVDTKALRFLSSDAVVPEALKLVDDENAEISEGAKRILAKRADKLFDIKTDKKTGEVTVDYKDYDYLGFNIREYKAKKLLKDNFDIYSEIGAKYYW